MGDKELFFKDCIGTGNFSSNDGFGMRDFLTKMRLGMRTLSSKERVLNPNANFEDKSSSKYKLLKIYSSKINHAKKKSLSPTASLQEKVLIPLQSFKKPLILIQFLDKNILHPNRFFAEKRNANKI